MMAAMLTNGTEGRSEQELAATVEDMGATLSAWATLDSVDVSGSVITLEEGARERFLGILHDVLRHATLPEDALVRTRELRLSTVARLADNHDALADAAFLSFLYGDAPRGARVRAT